MRVSVGEMRHCLHRSGEGQAQLSSSPCLWFCSSTELLLSKWQLTLQTGAGVGPAGNTSPESSARAVFVWEVCHVVVLGILMYFHLFRAHSVWGSDPTWIFLCVARCEPHVQFTESQNNRMVGVGRALCGSPSPTPFQSRVTYSRLHKMLSGWVLIISREGDSTTSLGSLGQCSIILRGKKFFLMFSWNFLCFSLCPLPLVLSLGTAEKSLAPSS